jgi:hypothetical protein
LPAVQLGPDCPASKHHPQVENNRATPQIHQHRFIELKATNPAVFRFLETAGRNQDMEMAVEDQKPAERLANNQQKHPNAVFVSGPLLDYRRSDCGQVF